MIRLAAENDFSAFSACSHPAVTDGAVRIRSWHVAYGTQTRFLSSFTDGRGTFLSVMDGFAVLADLTGEATDGAAVDEEWAAFIAMHPDIRRVRCAHAAGERLAAALQAPVATGEVQRCDACPPSGRTDGLVPVRTVRAEGVYRLLCDVFPDGALPPFDAFYVDLSHRLRHGLCRIAAVEDPPGTPLACAMTVAEAPDAVVIGAVATAPQRRRRGYASSCIRALLAEDARPALIAPNDDAAARLYRSLGFSPCGGWAELSFPGK